MSGIEKPSFGGDKSRLFAIYNSSGAEHLILAENEGAARLLARRCFDLVRTHHFISKEVPKDYLQTAYLLPLSDRLKRYMKDGVQGKIRIDYKNAHLFKVEAFFFAYGWSHEVKL